MGVGLIDEHEKSGLLNFLRSRGAKDGCVAIFAGLSKKHEIKRGEITLAKEPTYQQIVDSIDTALRNDWLTEAELTSFLDQTEAAGRQHVLLFSVPVKKNTELSTALSSPNGIGTGTSLAEYWEPPDASFARVLDANVHGAAVKVVTKRKYYVHSKPRNVGKKEVIEREAHWERSAVIVKFVKQMRVLQIRVPVLEKSADDNPKVLWDLANSLFSDHFGLTHLNQLQLFPLTDAFLPILDNKEDFVMARERKDDGEYYGDVGRRRREKDGRVQDLREANWTNDGKPRLRVDGAWAIGDSQISCRMHFEKVKLDKKTSKEFARLFIPQSCTDHEMDHVIRRIHEHIPKRD